MYHKMLLILMLLLRMEEILACVATSSVGTTTASGLPTTTPGLPTTTVTLAPTTTTAAMDCQSCQASQVTFTQVNPADPSSVSATSMDPGPDPATSCKRLTAICTANTGMFAFMQFNAPLNIGGPEQINVMEVTAVLECRADEKWWYEMTPITEVNCYQSSVPRTPPMPG